MREQHLIADSGVSQQATIHPLVIPESNDIDLYPLPSSMNGIPVSVQDLHAWVGIN